MYKKVLPKKPLKLLMSSGENCGSVLRYICKNCGHTLWYYDPQIKKRKGKVASPKSIARLYNYICPKCQSELSERMELLVVSEEVIEFLKYDSELE